MKRLRTAQEWLNAQGMDEVRELFICQFGRVMEGWVNVKTGKRIITKLRRATSGDEARKQIRRIGRRLGILQKPKPGIILP